MSSLLLKNGVLFLNMCCLNQAECFVDDMDGFNE